MKSRLTIENNNIVISDVSLHSVPKLKMKITSFWMIPEINSLAIVSDDVLSTGVLAVTSTH